MKKTIFEVYVDGVKTGCFDRSEDVDNYVNQLTQNEPYFLASGRVECANCFVERTYLDLNVL